jgi:hypothetical protein
MLSASRNEIVVSLTRHKVPLLSKQENDLASALFLGIQHQPLNKTAGEIGCFVVVA